MLSRLSLFCTSISKLDIVALMRTIATWMCLALIAGTGKRIPCFNIFSSRWSRCRSTWTTGDHDDGGGDDGDEVNGILNASFKSFAFDDFKTCCQGWDGQERGKREPACPEDRVLRLISCLDDHLQHDEHLDHEREGWSWWSSQAWGRCGLWLWWWSWGW